MRPITKILLLVLVAFAVYLLWPRTADLKTFDPAKLAHLELAEWQAQKKGKGFDALVAQFKIYTSQYHFDPVSAFRIAQSQGAAMKQLKLSQADKSDPTSESRSLQAFTEKYTWIKKQTKASFDADAMARDEFAWRLLELDGGAPDDLAAALSRVLAGLYGGDSQDFMEVATGLVTARAIIFKDEPPADGGTPSAAATTLLTEAYKLLHEIAATPYGEAAQ